MKTVITYQDDGHGKISMCAACEQQWRDRGEWPTNNVGREYCTVSHGQHYGSCDLCEAAEVTGYFDGVYIVTVDDVEIEIAAGSDGKGTPELADDNDARSAQQIAAALQAVTKRQRETLDEEEGN